MIKRINENKIILLTMFVCIVILFYLSGMVFIQTNKETAFAINMANKNVQTYVTDEGDTHNIYWAKGVDAPKMAADSKLSTNLEDRNFFRFVNSSSIGDYISYSYPIEEGKGYYDFNKDSSNQIQRDHHCYLAAATNLIYWWLDNNSAYIDKFITALQNGDILQNPLLKPIIDEDMWNKYRSYPKLKTNSEGYSSYTLLDNIIYKEVFRPYHTKDLGYYSDLVWDYFFNGYKALKATDSKGGTGPYSPNDWEPDIEGGLFYSIFGKKQITKRQTIASYESFVDAVKESIVKGNPIVISIRSGENNHALTVWGAEFDSNGALDKIYITDSDDYHNVDMFSNKNLKGLHSQYVIKASDGVPKITELKGVKDAGGQIIEIATLSLGQEEFETVLNDLSAPIKPKFEKDLNDVVYSSEEDELFSISVNVVKEDRGELFYEWYVSDNEFDEGNLILGENKSSIKPKPIADQPKYYYCKVTNVKNGKEAVSYTNRAKVYVNANITHAKKPIVAYKNNKTAKYKQYDIPIALEITAERLDDGELSYQWYQKESELNKNPVNGQKIEGAIYSKYYPPTYVEGIATAYYCIVTNTNKNVSGNKIITTSPPETLEVIVLGKNSLIEAKTPMIELQPANIIECKIGDLNPTISVHASSIDGGTISYQWYKASDEFEVGEKIEGATSFEYVPDLNVSKSSYYYCKIKNTNNNARNNRETTIDSSRTKLIVSGDVPVLSNNAFLKDLSTSVGKLDPSFEKNRYKYNINLKHNENFTMISASAEESSAQIEGCGKVEVNNGDSKTIEIKVVAEDGATTKIYQIIIKRDNVPSNDNKLTNLVIEGVNLSPDFSSTIYEYSGIVENETTKVNITPTLSSNKASFKISENKDALVVGMNTITIIVTAEDGSLQNYVIKITRKEKQEIVEPEIPPVDPNPEIPDIDDGEKQENNKTNQLIIIISILIAMLISIIICVLIIKLRKK